MADRFCKLTLSEKMEAIKKKMNAMKTEKDNALDKAEELTQKHRESDEAKAKVEEDLVTLQKKFSHLEGDYDCANEQLTEAQTKLETSEKRVTEDLDAVEADSDTNMNRISPERHHRLRSKSENSEKKDGVKCDKCDTSGHSKKSKHKKVKRKKRPKETTSEDEADTTRERRKERHKHKSKKDRQKYSSSSLRPEPEGGNPTGECNTTISEFEKVIYSMEPIFSDLDISDDRDLTKKRSDLKMNASGRPRQSGSQMSTSGVIMACPYLAINSNTMIKYSIISSELHSIVDCCRRVCKHEA